ncbi:uncharacterized protein LOC111260277 isoform X2 [Varroa jacobsoni]|uniref:uncharacterized protein LOC111260277 isoform X2 n=1 Tax=Varroa jacobsoni TaxID=62625 RepID=UPI000BF5772B|nr:uncharacterized protein LOC111260277 isoform X2 [Varroa jacobsoni]
MKALWPADRAADLRLTAAVRASSSSRSMKCVLPPLTGLLACGLLGGLINSTESAQAARFAASPDAARERSATTRLGDDLSLPNVRSDARYPSSSAQQSFGGSQASIVDTFENCAALFRFALDNLSPEERQTALANWCSKALSKNIEDVNDDSMLIGNSEMLLGKRAVKIQKFMHFGRKRGELDAFSTGSAPSAVDMDKHAGQNRMLHFGKRYNTFADYQDAPDRNEALRQLDEPAKRAGQNRMLHFGKRSPNRFMHFGKRNPDSQFLHFGKKIFDQSDFESYPNKHVNRFMHFGKRDDEQADAATDLEHALDDDFVKKLDNNRFMHFGKKRAESQKYMHFGKRSSNELGLDSDSTASSYMDRLLKRNSGKNRYVHFGKKSTNRFMHFGKRAELGQELGSGTFPVDVEDNSFLVDQQDQLHERRRRSILSDADGAGFRVEFGLDTKEIRPASQKRFTITYPSPIFQQALLRHRLDLLDKVDVEDSDGGLNGVSGPLGQSGSGPLNQRQPNTATFIGSEDLLDRMGRSEQFQIPQPRVQSRWTRPDRNVFLHFG